MKNNAKILLLLLFLLFFIIININAKEIIVYKIRYNHEIDTDNDELEHVGELLDLYFNNEDLAALERLFQEEREKFAARDYDYYKSLKWGWAYPQEIQYHDSTSYNSDSNCLSYSIENRWFIEDATTYPFKKVKNDTILLPDYSLGFEPFSDYSVYQFYQCNENLIIMNEGVSEILFTKKNKFSNYYGDCYFVRDYAEIDFFNYKFTDISEFYLKVDEDNGYGDYLLWFDKEYNLIRLDALSDVNGVGITILSE